MSLGYSKFEQLGGKRAVNLKAQKAKAQGKELSEAEEQRELIKALDRLGILYFHVPNENPSARERMKGASLGVKAGVPDLVVFMQEVILFIELKAKDKIAKITPEQLWWNERLNTYEYARAYICRGANEALEIILAQREQEHK